MDQDTKIVFIHKGNKWYLPYALYQAKYASPNSDIVLLGDSLKYKEIQVIHLDNIQSGDMIQFKKHYRHMSTNSEQFELFCWQRWFYLFNYMQKYRVRSVLYLDSDVLLYSSIEDIKRAYSDMTWECGFSIPRQNSNPIEWAASGHVSYWTIDSLEDFCRLIVNTFLNQEYLELYKKIWNWHLTQQIPGGVSDMTALYLLWEANTNRIINMAKSYKSNAFDHNINMANNYMTDQYVTEFGIKKIKFVNRQPFIFRANEEERLDCFHSLHFQGAAKKYIRRFYTGKTFRGKTYCDTLFIFESSKNKIGNFFKQLNVMD
jgi:hypothetical protein